MAKTPQLTTSSGAPVADKQSSITAGPMGPGERGAADAERDVRGFALRFYTSEANWDIVGNNSPNS